MFNNVGAIQTAIFQKTLGHFESVFPPDQERELINYIKLMEARFHGLALGDLHKLTFEVKKLKIPDNLRVVWRVQIV